uniref:Amino acid permease n=1 Tax=Rodentolepis nana TaxID=102285 RepID=A0A0R3TFZ2_RODNA
LTNRTSFYASLFQTFAQRLYSHGWWIMSIFVALSTFGGVNGAMLTTSRIFFVAGEESQMPRIMAFLHIHKLTPLPAVVFTAFFSLLYLSVTDLYKLMNYLGFVQWFAISLSVLIVLIFRVTRKNAIRPVRVPIILPIIYVGMSAFLIIFSFVGAPMESLYGCAIIATGIPVYLLGITWSPKPKCFQKKVDAITTGAQKALQLAPQN